MNRIKIMKIISQLLLAVIVIGGVFLLLINFKVISFSSSDLPEVINLNKVEVGIKEKETFQLTADVLPDDVYRGKIKWASSDPSVAIVNEVTGFVTAKKNGSAVITASVDINNLEAECVVHVASRDIVVEKINISHDRINLLVGNKYTLKYSVSPKNATVYNFEYRSSDTDIVTVSSKGVITAKKAGLAIVTVSSRNGTAKDTVVVRAYNKTSNNSSNKIDNTTINSVVLSKTSIKLVVGGTSNLKASILPASANQSVTWSSSNNNVLKVDSIGTITAVGIGTANVVATSINGKNAVAKVIVSDGRINLTEISIKENLISLELGKEKRIPIEFTPNNATDQGIIWSSSNNNILKIDNGGNILPVSIGSAVVTAVSKDGGHRDFVTVEITQPSNLIPEENIIFTNNSVNLSTGNTLNLTPLITPSDATYKTVTWTTSNRNIVTVDDGMVYGVSSGTAIITAKTKYSGLEARVTVTVNNVKVSGVSLSQTSLTLNVNETKALVAAITPSDASVKDISWHTNDSSVIQIDQNGIVKAVGVGRAIVTVKTKDGNKRADIIIEVVN